MKKSLFIQKNNFSHNKNWSSLLKNIEIERKQAILKNNSDLYDYGANNPVRYIDPDGFSEIDHSSLKKINEAESYRSNMRTCDSYIKQTLKITNQIGNLQQKIGQLKNEIFDMEIEYKEQVAGDALTVFSVFMEALCAAKKESNDLFSFCILFILNIDPQNLAETASDYSNNSRLSKNELNKTKQEKQKQIKQLEMQIKGLQAELKSLDKEISKMKKEMQGSDSND